MTTRLDDFRKSTYGHLAVAKAVLEGRGLIPREPPSALERRLSRQCRSRVFNQGAIAVPPGVPERRRGAERSTRRPTRVYSRARKGTTLKKLAGEVGLQESVKLEGGSWADDGTWMRMTSSERPYALRYGAEEVSPVEADAEVTRTHTLVKTLLAGIGHSRRPRNLGQAIVMGKKLQKARPVEA